MQAIYDSAHHVERQEIRTGRVTTENGEAAPQSGAIDSLVAKSDEVLKPLFEQYGLTEEQHFIVTANIHYSRDNSGNWERGQVTFLEITKKANSRPISQEVLDQLLNALNNARLVVPISGSDARTLFGQSDNAETGESMGQTGIIYYLAY